MVQLPLFLKKGNFLCLEKTLHIVIILQVVSNEKDNIISYLSNIDSSCKPTVLLKISGLVTDLKDVRVTQVSLGKAHAVALTNKGHVYTFGINNKGQCGRDFAAQIKEGAVPLNLIHFVIHKSIKTEEEKEEELQILCVQLSSLILHTYFVCTFKSISNATCLFAFITPLSIFYKDDMHIICLCISGNISNFQTD